MKLIEGQKQVEYFGLTLYVPEWAKWIATDESGLVCSFIKKPTTLDTVFNSTAFECVCKVNLEGMDFRDTLMEVK